MEKVWLEGNFSEVPFHHLLFRTWKARRTGTLFIDTGSKKRLDFKNGDICVTTAAIADKSFSKTLIEKYLHDHPELKSIKTLQDLLDQDIMTPDSLWQEIRKVFSQELYPLFDCPKGVYNFNSEHGWEEHEILFYLPTLDFILHGIRSMKNHALISAQLPVEKSELHLISPDYLNQIRLSPPEIYLYHVIENKKNLADIYKTSQLGKKETKKMIFGFISLGLIGPPEAKAKNQTTADFSQAEIHNLLEAFNLKCSFIFKYLSKEIGPAAWNVLENCVAETRSHLSPFFQNMRFDSDGKIELNSVQITGTGLQGHKLKQILIKDLNEILAAEILAVKRTLGNAHEAALVRSLE